MPNYSSQREYSHGIDSSTWVIVATVTITMAALLVAAVSG